MKSIILLIVASHFYACSDPSVDASVTDSSRPGPVLSSARCKVASFSIANMYFDELANFSVAFSPDFTNRIGLSYSNGRISQVHGGLMAYPAGGTVSGYFWRNDFNQDIVYSGNTITVNSPGMYSKQFVIANNKIQSQYITYNVSSLNIMHYSPGLREYQYVDNKIIENAYGYVRRIFYIENGNLAKVELFFRNQAGEIVKKVEYLLTNYDTNPNLLKGKFFINGNFFKAFSKNNYGKLEMNTYNVVNNEYQLDSDQYSMFIYNIPSDMFIQDCN